MIVKEYGAGHFLWQLMSDLIVKLPVYYRFVASNITHATPEEIYTNYKSGNNIEIMIEAMKNVLKADSSYMRNQTALEGWMFISFIALQLYYRIYKLLSEKQLLSKFTPQDILVHLAEIKKVKINDSWHTS